jgi:hypothetical protein
LQTLGNLREQQASSLAYVDVFWALAVMVALVFGTKVLAGGVIPAKKGAPSMKAAPWWERATLFRPRMSSDRSPKAPPNVVSETPQWVVTCRSLSA